MIAEGVKGLLRISKESFVVWALRMAEASERSARGFGDLVTVVGWSEKGDLRTVLKFSRREVVEIIEERRAEKCSSFVGAMMK